MAMQDHRQAIGLYRYSLVRALEDPELTPRQRGALISGLVSSDHLGPDQKRSQVSAVTLRRWLRAYRAGGFQALVPAPRRQANRIPEPVIQMAETLKREAPKRSAGQVARSLEEAGVGQVSARTLRRHFARLGLNASADGSHPRAYGRFEAPDFGVLWTGDGLHGPRVGGTKTVLLAFIDDWSRCVPGWRFGPAEDTVGLEAALRRGLEVAGIPRAVFVDHGSAFVSDPFHRTLAVLGIRIIHSKVGYPASRGKIERFFGTVRRQFLVELEARGGAKGLPDLNELFGAWLEGVYHRSVHSETGETPLARRLRGARLRRPTPAELHEAFLWRETRLTTKTASVSLFGNHFEVDPALVGCKVDLLFDPFDMSDIEVRYQGRPMGKAVPRKITRHTHPRARPEAAPPPRASGIDYLGLVKARMAEEDRARIAYAGIAPEDPPGQPGSGAGPGQDPSVSDGAGRPQVSDDLTWADHGDEKVEEGSP